MVTDEQILEAVASLRSQRRTATIETLSTRLGIEDVTELESQLVRLARTGQIWMMAWWFTERADEPTRWSYWPRLSDDPTNDLS